MVHRTLTLTVLKPARMETLTDFTLLPNVDSLATTNAECIIIIIIIKVSGKLAFLFLSQTARVFRSFQFADRLATRPHLLPRKAGLSLRIWDKRK